MKCKKEMRDWKQAAVMVRKIRWEMMGWLQMEVLQLIKFIIITNRMMFKKDSQTIKC